MAFKEGTIITKTIIRTFTNRQRGIKESGGKYFILWNSPWVQERIIIMLIFKKDL